MAREGQRALYSPLAMKRRGFLAAVGLGGATAVVGVAASRVEAVAKSDTVDNAGYARTQRGQTRVVWSVATDSSLAALTFDDGPNPRYTPRVLETLAAHGIHATFFLIGVNAQRHPDLAKATVAAGHEIGNHTLNHRTLMEHSSTVISDEVSGGSDAIHNITGVTPRWFRAPRGRLTGTALAEAAQLGQDVAMWSVMRGGPEIADDDDAGVARQLGSSLHPGAIIDLHDGLGATEDGRASLRTRREAEMRALDSFITEATSRGYRFVTLTELVNSASASPVDAERA